MNTEHTALSTRRAWLRALAAGLGLAGGGAWAQLSNPVPGAKAVTPGSGQGLGTHSPDSPFPQMSARSDTVPWTVLGEVKVRTEKNRILPVYPVSIMALNQKTQRIQGYMMPLEPGERQRHFLLSSVPLTCSFCTPGGPESIVEVRTREPVRYAMEPVVVEGRFEVLADDPYGVYYRMSNATQVR